MSLLIALCIILGAGCVLQTLRIKQLRNRPAPEQLHDPLTGLYQRPHLFALAEREVNRAQRSQHKMAVLIADMDHCAQINAQYGLQAGDLALKRLAECARASVRDCDLVGRYSGENNSGFYISITIGLAALSTESDTLEDILVAADTALKSAKQLGIDRIEVFPTAVTVMPTA